MTTRTRTNSVQSERAILVGVHLHAPVDPHNPLAELGGLANTAGAVVVAELSQRRDRPDQKTYLGKGKVIELAGLIARYEADVVIFDNDLSAAQTRNLEHELKVKVLDRSEVILDIFAARARTSESRLAVELAQLEYALPRLKRLWTHLSRLKMGIGMRGPGEKQLEVDRRLVEKRIHDLKQELLGIKGRKERQVAGRKDLLTVSLVGYTNAGKSTLLNALTGANVLTEDKLFATLDTRTRRWKLPDWGPVLLSDTVDLLLHIADASSPLVDAHISAVRSVLKEIGVEEKDTLLVLNKIDAVTDRVVLGTLLARHPHAVCLSAHSGAGLAELARTTSDYLGRGFCDVDIQTDPGNGRLLAWIGAHGEVLSQHFVDDCVTIHCRIPSAQLGRIAPGEAVVRPHAPPTGTFSLSRSPAVLQPADSNHRNDEHEQTLPNTPAN